MGRARSPVTPGKTRPVLQTGEYGANIGHITLTVDRADDAVTSYTTQNVPRTTVADATLVAAYPRVAAGQDDRRQGRHRRRRASIGNVPVGSSRPTSPRAFTGAGRDDRGVGVDARATSWPTRCATSCPRTTVAAAQIGVVNPGGLRADLRYATRPRRRRSITYAEANAVLPFVNNLWTLGLTGAQFKQVLEQQWQPAASTRPFLNLGLSDNVTYTYDADAPRRAATSPRSRSTALPIDPTDSYRIGTFSLPRHGGDNFTAFTRRDQRPGHRPRRP